MKVLVVLFFSSLSLNLHAQVMHAGSMSEMSTKGFSPTISLDSLLKKEHLYGLGPYGKMQGEITVMNGVPLIAYANETGELNVRTDYKAKAPFFVYAYVSNWKSYEVELSARNPLDIQEAVHKLAKAQGLDASNPFPFRIQGEFDQLTIHVVSPRSSDVPGYKSGITSYKFNFNTIQGEILGFYSQHNQGVYTNKDSFIHLHFSTEDQSKMGHIDAIALNAKKVKISLPSNVTNKVGMHVNTLDTDFSKGRLTHIQSINRQDLEKFHGHLYDGLVMGALGIQEAMKVLYPNQAIDRTNLRIVSKPSPCLTDAAIYLTGGRYQFNSFYVDPNIDGLYIIQRIDNLKTVLVSLNNGIKPPEIDRLGNIALQQNLSPCALDDLRKLEDEFTDYLLQANPEKIFTVKTLSNFKWQPLVKNDYVKTDILGLKPCKE